MQKTKINFHVNVEEDYHKLNGIRIKSYKGPCPSKVADVYCSKLRR